MVSNATDDQVTIVTTGWDAKWVNQSLQMIATSNSDFKGILYFMIIYSMAILFHSAFINGRKFRVIRVVNDFAAVVSLIQAAAFLRCSSGCSLRESAYLLNVLANTICGGISQICDNYIVFNRYVAVAYSVTNTHKYIALIYLFLFGYVSWVPFFTIVPWFYDVNGVFVYSLVVLLSIYGFFLSYVLYDLFYTLLIVRRLTGVTLRSLAIKSIIHNIISVCGAIAYSFWFPYGVLIYNIAVMTSIHFLFNWKIERAHWKYVKKQSIGPSSITNVVAASPSAGTINTKAIQVQPTQQKNQL